MKKKIAQFFCFVFWSFAVVAAYVLGRYFFFPPTPPIFLWLLSLFLATAAMTVKEAFFAVDNFGENGGWISAGLVVLFGFYQPPGASFFVIPPATLSLLVGFGTVVIATTIILFFSRRKDSGPSIIKSICKWIILVVWSAWLGFSMYHVVTGSGWIFFVESWFVGFLCALGGMILIVLLLILRKITEILFWLHRYAIDGPAKT